MHDQNGILFWQIPFIESLVSALVCHKNWSAEESRKSSTWSSPACNTDDQNVVRIIQAGSMVKNFTFRRQIHLNISWLPRDQNSQAYFLGKIVDFDDYFLHDKVFFHVENLWGPHSVDKLACSYAKLPRFNSRFVQPGTEAVDAFLQDWSPENNWLVPPINISH